MKKNILYLLIGVFSITILYSCNSKGKYSNISNKTGIPYNKRESGGFEVNSEFNRSAGPGLVAIEGGSFTLGGSATDDVTGENNNARRRVTIPSFYMDETEVSNTNWLEYLHWIGTNFPDDREYYYNELPDTLVWRNPLSYNEPYVENYLRHPAYQDYPVVGVTWEQAERYCKWRTDRVNESMLISKGYLANYEDNNGKGGQAKPVDKEPFNTDVYLNGQYKGAGIDGKNMRPDLSAKTGATPQGKGKNYKGPVRPIRLEDGVIFQAYRLPTEAEWEFAALGLYGNTVNEDITDAKIFPWNGFSMREAKGKTQGLFLANFRRTRGDNMGVAGYLNDKGDLTVPVKYYLPNDYGLYNMSGNVNEWTNDVYRQLTFEDVNSFNPYRGNQFTEKKFEDNAKGTLAKDKYGNAIFAKSKAPRKQTWAQLQQGVVPDSLLVLANSVDDTQGAVYNPDARGFKDTTNAELFKYTTLVNDKSRVYKGGSWNDGAYWLNPATRRYLDQDQSSSEIGFRCAMTMLGDPEIGRSKSKTPHFKKPLENRYDAKKRVEKGNRF